MGWNTSALFVSERPASDLLRLLPDDVLCVLTDEEVSADQATANLPGGRIYLADGDHWSQLWDPDLRFVPGTEKAVEDGPRRLDGSRLLAVVFSSVASIYGFWVHDDGELVRRAIFQHGEPIDEVGEPLPFESSIEVPSWGHDENFVWSVIQAITGQGYDQDQRYAVHLVEP
jgi:hypothetical protein